MKAQYIASIFVLLGSTSLYAHGDVTPQAVDTKGLPVIGDEWLTENPWRDPANEFWGLAIEVGASGYNSNCARCHGLEVVSGGLAPDLRYLEADEFGDEWYLERFRHGMTQNGITKMPAFEGILSQEAAWAIRTYIETRPDDGALDALAPRLNEIKEELGSGTANIVEIKAELEEMNKGVETGSGAPVAESAITRAAAVLDINEKGTTKAIEILTIGLSAAK